MKVVIFGATGLSGKVILKEALSKNHEVTILVRNVKDIAIQDKNLTVVQGNVLDRNTVNEVLKNQDAVIQSLGVGGKGNGKPTTFVSDANKIILEEMEKTNVKRYIAMSNIGAGDSYTYMPWIFRKLILPYFMRWLQVIVDDKNRMEPMIMKSNLDWTIVRSAGMVDKPAKGKVTHTITGQGLKFTITLSDLARFIVEQLVVKKYIKKTPSVSN
ncbi:MAG: NAD(P)H-binding protein [Chitinophagales bacterium]|nr:NAD(P)H-binding protein [Chitinophagales bacterium]